MQSDWLMDPSQPETLTNFQSFYIFRCSVQGVVRRGATEKVKVRDFTLFTGEKVDHIASKKTLRITFH